MSVNVLIDNDEKQKEDLSKGPVFALKKLVSKKTSLFLHKKTKFTFIDLFAGICGMQIAFQNLGGKCVFSSKIDEQAQKHMQ